MEIEITNIENEINLQNDKIEEIKKLLFFSEKTIHNLKDKLIFANIKKNLEHVGSENSMNFMKTFVKLETKSKRKDLKLIGNTKYEDYGKFVIKLYTEKNTVLYLSFEKYYYHNEGYTYNLELCYNKTRFTHKKYDDVDKDDLDEFLSKLNLNKREFLKILRNIYKIFDKVFFGGFEIVDEDFDEILEEDFDEILEEDN